MNPLLPLYQPADGPFVLDAETDLRISRRLLARDLMLLQRIECRLRCPVYLRGPRRGKPMDAADCHALKAWASRVRKGIACYLARIVAMTEPEPHGLSK